MSRPGRSSAPPPEVKRVPGATRVPLGPIIGVVLLAVVLVAVLVWALTRPDEPAAQDDGSPLQATGSANALPEGGGIVVGPAPGEGVTEVHLYEDFQCPWCGVLERSVGGRLSELAQAGEVRVTHTVMSFLDRNLGNDSSTRAANAALCADDAGVFGAFHAAVYANQPEQEGAGFTDEQFVGWAGAAGLDGAELDAFEQCVQQQRYADYVADMQARAARDGVGGTPRMVVDGTELEPEEMDRLMNDPDALDAVLAARP